MFNVLNFIGNKKGKAGIFMKISKKLTIMLFGILLIGCVLNGAVKRKNPVINDKRREVVFKKFNFVHLLQEPIKHIKNGSWIGLYLQMEKNIAMKMSKFI